MLKQLIGHWKAHRKKPTLLPEETEVHFEDTTKTNPIFEDNEAAVTSEALGQLSAVIDSIALELDHGLSDSSRTDSDSKLIDINGEILSPDKEKLKISDFKAKNDTDHSSPLEKSPLQPNKSFLASLTNSSKNNISTEGNSRFDLRSVKNKPGTSECKDSLDHKEFSNNTEIDVEISDKDDLRETEIDIKDKRDNKNSVSKSTDSVPEHSQNNIHEFKEHSTSSSDYVNKKTVESDVKEHEEEHKFQRDMILKIQEFPTVSPAFKKKDDLSTETKSSVPTSSSTQRIESDNLSVNRLPAIAELIKKFQNQPIGELKPINTGILNAPSVTNNNRQEIDKGIVKTSSSTTKTDKETITQFFSIPPPPPIESPKTTPTNRVESFLHNKSSLTLAQGQSNNNSSNEARTRSDSSLDRNKTISTHFAESTSSNFKTPGAKTEVKTFNENQNIASTSKSQNQSNLNGANETANFSKTSDPNLLRKNSSLKKNEIPKIILEETEPEDDTKSIVGTSKNQKNNAATTSEDTSFIPISNSKNIPEKRTLSFIEQKNLNKSSLIVENNAEIISKTASNNNHEATVSSQADNLTSKVLSENNGVTRGDQVSSEETQDEIQPKPTTEKNELPPKSIKKSKKERKLSHSREKNCKHSKRPSSFNTPLKRSKCDEYYDILTGVNHSHKSKNSEGWTSDLSFEEIELIRKLRNKRESLRSDVPSIRSKISKRHHADRKYFHRAHYNRHSFSDDSTRYGSSLCSCDACWMMFVKDYAYDRASLRGPRSVKAQCTCRPLHPEFLSRKVTFRSEPIPEVSTIERSMTTSSIPEDDAKKETTTTDASERNDNSKENILKDKKSAEKSISESKKLKEKYRLMTPWELEEWDLAMRRHLLTQRRKRARNMGLIALAMVIIIGIVVTGVLVYLRRRNH